MKSTILIVGRFQPLTRGHLRLISAAKKEFETGAYDSITTMIIAGKKTSKDKKRNPLTGEERKKFMSKQREFNGVNIVIAETINNGIKALQDSGIKIGVIVGGTATKDNPDENTAEAYQELIKKYFEYSPKKITVERDPDKKGTISISATMLRHAALNGDWEEFRDNVGYDQETAENVYHIIRKINGVSDE